MDQRQELLEQYEDALFALAMDEVAVEQGRAYLEENRRLREEEVPQSVLLRGRRTLRRAFARRGLNQAGRLGSRAMRVASTLCLLFLVVFTSAFAALPQFRVDTFNFVIETFGDSKALYFGGSQASHIADAPQILATWRPAGYSLAESSSKQDRVWYLFTNSSGNRISVDWYRIDTLSAILRDQEDAQMENMTVRGQDALVITKDNEHQILFYDSEAGSLLTIWSDALEFEDLLTFAENLIVQ